MDAPQPSYTYPIVTPLNRFSSTKSTLGLLRSHGFCATKNLNPDNIVGKHPHHPDESFRWFSVFDDVISVVLVILF